MTESLAHQIQKWIGPKLGGSNQNWQGKNQDDQNGIGHPPPKDGPRDGGGWRVTQGRGGSERGLLRRGEGGGKHVKSHQFGSKVLPVCSSDMCCFREGICKGDTKITEIEELEEMDVSELHTMRLNAKDVLTSTKGDQFLFQVEDGTNKVYGGDRELRASRYPGLFTTGREQEVLRDESDGTLSPQNLFKMTLHWVIRKLKMILGLKREISFVVITWNPESNCTCREKNHFLFAEVRRRHEKHTYIIEKYFWKILIFTGQLVEKGNYQMHGRVSQDSFDWTKDHLTDFHCLGGRVMRKQTISSLDNVCRVCGNNCPMQRSAKQSKSRSLGIQNSTILDNYGIFSSLNQMMWNLNIQQQTLVESWKFWCQQQCLWKHQ